MARAVRLRVPVNGRSTGLGSAAGLVWVTATVLALLPLRDDVSLATPALVLELAVVVAGLVGGARASTVAAVAAAATLNWAFIPPYGTFKVDAWEDWVALAVFLTVAGALSLLLASEAARRRGAEQEGAEVRALYDRLTAATAERERLTEEAERAHVLERVDEQRSALLRSISHDLRTPLATIRAVASELRDGAVYDEATRAELLGTVCDESERLDRIVANLLSLSRIEAGALKPDRQAVPVDELVTDRLRRLAPLFGKIRVEVSLAPDLPLADADYTQLDLVLTNLLENAARHAPPGSTLRIIGRGRQGNVELRIADEGIGVPEWQRARIFEPFRQGEGGGSSGVGLAICKAIVEAHGGRIRVERTAGGGATFVVTIPARPAPSL